MSRRTKAEKAEAAAAQKRDALRKLTTAVSLALVKDTAHASLDVIDTVINDAGTCYIDVTLDGRDMRIVMEDHHTQ